MKLDFCYADLRSTFTHFGLHQVVSLTGAYIPIQSVGFPPDLEWTSWLHCL